MPSDMNALIRLLAAGAPPLSSDQGVTGQEVDRPPPAPPSISQSPREGGRSGWDPAPPTPTYVDPRDLARDLPPDPRLIEQYPYDDLPRGSGQDDLEIDPRFAGEVNRNPDGAEAGPLYLSPEAKLWMRQIIDAGFSVDWGTNTIFNPDTGEEYPVPTSFPKMM